MLVQLVVDDAAFLGWALRLEGDWKGLEMVWWQAGGRACGVDWSPHIQR